MVTYAMKIKSQTVHTCTILFFHAKFATSIMREREIYERAVKYEDPLTPETIRERGDYEPEESIGVLHIEC